MVKDAVARLAAPNEGQQLRIEELVKRAAEAAWEKKALGLTVIDVGGLVSYADYIVICSGTSDRQLSAISDSIQQSLKEVGCRPLGHEGRTGGHWVLIDYGDFVVHIFSEAERDVYGLESLFRDAPCMQLEAPPDLERPAYY